MIYTSKRLRLLLTNLGLTQRELAFKADITESAVSRYLDGSRIPNANTIIQITEATKVSPSWLLGYGEDNKMETI